MSPRKSSGFTLIELAIVMTIIGVVMAFLMQGLAEVQFMARAKRMASAMEAIHQAAVDYVVDNYTTIDANLAGGGTLLDQPITVLQTAGNLSANVETTDPWGNAYEFSVCRPAAGSLRVTVTSGALTGSLDLRDAAYVASRITNVEAALTGQTLPAYTSFNAGVACFGAAVPNNAVATLETVGSTQVLSDFLYRNPVPGHPEANTMFADLTMDPGTNIAVGSGGEVQLATGAGLRGATGSTVVLEDGAAMQMEGTADIEMVGQGRFLGNALMDKAIVTNNTTVTAPWCEKVGKTAVGYAAITAFGINQGAGVGVVVTSCQAYLEAVVAGSAAAPAQWRVKLRCQKTDGSWTEPLGAESLIEISAKCI